MSNVSNSVNNNNAAEEAARREAAAKAAAEEAAKKAAAEAAKKAAEEAAKKAAAEAAKKAAAEEAAQGKDEFADTSNGKPLDGAEAKGGAFRTAIGQDGGQTGSPEAFSGPTTEDATPATSETTAIESESTSPMDAIRQINGDVSEVSSQRTQYFEEEGEYSSKNFLQANILDSAREMTTGYRDDRQKNYDQTLEKLDTLGQSVLSGEITPDDAIAQSKEIMQTYRQEDSRVRNQQIGVADTSAAVINAVGRDGVANTLSTVTRNPAVGTMYAEAFDVSAATSQRYREAFQPGFEGSQDLENRSALLLHADRMGLTGDTGAPVTQERIDAVAAQKRDDVVNNSIAAVSGHIAKGQTNQLLGQGMSIARANLNGQATAATFRGGMDVAKTALNVAGDDNMTLDEKAKAVSDAGVEALVGIPFAAGTSYLGAKLPGDTPSGLTGQLGVDVSSGLLEQETVSQLTGNELTAQDRIVNAASNGVGTINGLATHGDHIDSDVRGDTPIRLSWDDGSSSKFDVETPSTHVEPDVDGSFKSNAEAVDQTNYASSSPFMQDRSSDLPKPVQLDGQSYDIHRVNDDGTLLLQRDSAPEVYRNDTQLVGEKARFAGQDWEVTAVENSSVTFKGENGATETYPLDDLKTEAPDRPSFQFGKEGYHLDSTSDVGGIRFVPDEPLNSDAITISPQDLPPFEGVLKSRPHEGPYTIVPDQETGNLRATKLDADGQPGAWLDIEPQDLAPSYVDVPHSDFGNVKIPTTTVAKDDLELKGRNTHRGDNWVRPHGETSPVIGDPRIGSVSPDTEVTILPNAAAGQLLTESVKSSEGPLVVKMKAMEDGQGVNDFVDALVERRNQVLPNGEQTPVTVVMNPVEPMEPQHQSQLEQAGVKIVYPEMADNEVLVVHQKSVISENEALLSTGEMDPNPNKRKFEVAARLTGDDAKLLYDYEKLVAEQTGIPERRQMIEDLAERGVLVRDAQAGKSTVSRAINGIIEGAQQDLTLMASHKLSSPEATQQLIDAASRGVDVRVVTQGIDPQSKALINEAKANNPSLPLKVDIVDKKKFVHTHANIYVADGGKQAVTATAFLWPNHLRGAEATIPDGRSYENGLVFSGDQSRQLAEGVNELIESYTPHTVKQADGSSTTPTVTRRRLPAAP